jgi:hypothetical protein
LTRLKNSNGTRRGVVGKILYDPGETGKLMGVADRNDNPIIWYEHNGDEISAVRDFDSRCVE